MGVTIYHNPACGTSRNTLALIRAIGIEATVIEYLRDPPSRERLVQLIRGAGLTPRQLLREKGTPYADLGLDDPALTPLVHGRDLPEETLLDERPLLQASRHSALALSFPAGSRQRRGPHEASGGRE